MKANVSAGIETWPAVRDVVRQLDLSQPHVNRLIHRQQLRAVRTRLGYLVDPVSVAEFSAARQARRAAKRSA